MGNTAKLTGQVVIPTVSRQRRVAAWSVHLFTATGSLIGLLALLAIYRHEFIIAFWLMGAAIAVDAVDGLLARWAQTHVAAPEIDGALMDNILDYVTYVMAPAFLMVVSGLVPWPWGILGAGAIVLASAFQFSQTEAKTEDHFFTGFPSYWNIVVFYMFLLRLPPIINLSVAIFLAVMVFVPIKYVYPSRPDFLTTKRWLRRAMVGASLLWGVAAAMLLLTYPNTNPFWMAYSLIFFAFYILMSLYRTLFPLQIDRYIGPNP